MSKDIDFSQPLSEEDAAYVNDRPWLVQDQTLQGNAVEYDTPEEDDESEDDESEDDEEGEPEGDDDVAYTDMEYPRLKQIAAERGVDATGKKDLLVRRLEAFDAQDTV